MKVPNKINNWEVISEKLIRKHGRYYVQVRCTCGSNICKDLPKSHLTSQLSRGCEKCSRFHTSKGHELLSGEYWSHVVSGSKKRNIPFNITIEQAWDIYVKQNKKCALTDLDIIFEPNCTHNKEINNRKIRTASLDRVDSKKGYELHNIQWLHKDVNRMKNYFEVDYFKEICKLVCKKN